MSRVLLCVLCLMLLTACGGNPTAPPAYVKDVHLQQEGSDGVLFYFTLADANGAYTAADGRVFVTLEETPFNQPARPLFAGVYDVVAADFQATKVGQGALEHEVLLWSAGRVPYSQFDARPHPGSSGTIKVGFVPSATGQRIDGHDTAYFR